MKKIIAVLLILSTLFAFVSCGKKTDIPEGMQIIRGGESVGFYMYAPEEWTVANHGNISAAYASNVDSSSITYVETSLPDKTVKEYFYESLSEFPTLPTIITDGKEITFGNADDAMMFEYEHEYLEHKFRTMQIFVKYKDRFGIFTFNSPLENISSSELTQYEYYSDKLKDVISNFKFIDKSETDKKEEYTKDSDGYMLVSDEKISKFNLWIPEDWTVEYSSGIVSASCNDGSNITLAKATSTGVEVGVYLKTRIEDLKNIVTDLEVIKHENENGELKDINGKASFGNSKQAASQEYTFVYNGTTYHVYQVCAVTWFNGFVFTYTATEENYYKHLDVIEKIAEKVEFK